MPSRPGPWTSCQRFTGRYWHDFCRRRDAQPNPSISNNGTAALNISSATVVGSEFSIAATSIPLPVAVPAGSTSGIFALNFIPIAAGTRTGQLIVQDDAPGSPHTIPLTGFGVSLSPGDFAVLAPNNAPVTATVTAGQTATYHLVATGDPNNITLACSGAPAGAACSVQPSVGLTGGSILGSDSSEPVNISVSTTARTASLRGLHPRPWWALAGALLLALIASRKRGPRSMVLAVCATALVAGMTSCGSGGVVGGGGGGFTPAGTYTLTLTAAGNGGTTHTVPITLVVK